tara:strand:- start:582 stop:1298 length:717 start_codon:yes stop_codon:yes gene_type:complete
MKTTLLFTSVLLSVSLFGQNVYIPDANFKGYLVGNPNINTNGDSEIQVSEASAFTGSIYCYDSNITDITGIEAFTFLTQLNCAFNSLTSLDVSNNTALTEISCENNPLTSLDVSNNTALDVLICFDSEQLECLNIKNGNNTVMTLYLFDNPNLTCIEVDDENYSTANWTGDNIDSQIYFSENCNNDCSNTSSLTELTTSKNLIQILDLMGRETKFRPNIHIIYVYDDGSVEKVFSVEH